jgi:hypothetical protein
MHPHRLDKFLSPNCKRLRVYNIIFCYLDDFSQHDNYFEPNTLCNQIKFSNTLLISYCSSNFNVLKLYLFSVVILL